MMCCKTEACCAVAVCNKGMQQPSSGIPAVLPETLAATHERQAVATQIEMHDFLQRSIPTSCFRHSGRPLHVLAGLLVACWHTQHTKTEAGAHQQVKGTRSTACRRMG